MNTTNNHRATGHTTDRLVASLPWHVVAPSGRLLAGASTEARAEQAASVINQGRAEPVRVVKRGSKS